MTKIVRPDEGLVATLLFDTQGGDAGASRELVRISAPWLRAVAARYATRLGVPAFDVDDLVQETFCRLLDPRYQRYFTYACRRARVSRPSPGGFGPGHAYVVGHLLNAINYGTRKRRGRLADDIEVIESARPPQDPRPRLEARHVVLTLLEGVPPATRETLGCVYVDERTERETAALMHVSAATVCRVLRRFCETAAERLAG